MFSMFFGAGNVVFPLAAGQYAQDKNIYAILGLLITAVGVPFLGLLSMTLFDGDYRKFFSKIGTWPGFLIALCIMGLIGPLGAMPRVIALSFSTFNLFFPGVSLPVFSILSCVIIYLLTYKRSRILDILGYFLTPVLLGSLVTLIFMALFSSQSAPAAEDNAFSIFFHGLYQGYYTMDLMGAFFFSSVVILCLKEELHSSDKNLIIMTLKAAFIGAILLAAVYIGFSFAAAKYSDYLSKIPQDEMLGALALKMLGPTGGIVAVIAVTLACLTTAIALAAVFAEFMHKDITLSKLSYNSCLLISLVVTFLLSTLHFGGIMEFLGPILIICYPALIVLSFVNLLNKLWGFQHIKTPVAVTFVLTLMSYFIEDIGAFLHQ